MVDLLIGVFGFALITVGGIGLVVAWGWLEGKVRPTRRG